VVLVNPALTVIQFSTPTSLRESVLFLIGPAMRQAGFTLGRGDAEFNQADAPFFRSGTFGQIRINGLAACNSQWLVAIGAPRSGTSPLLAAPSVSPSPLSFGP
jgi:hypothetical protein